MPGWVKTILWIILILIIANYLHIDVIGTLQNVLHAVQTTTSSGGNTNG
jgi:hypothetical protein